MPRNLDKAPGRRPLTKHANEVFRYSKLSCFTSPNPISITSQRMRQGHQEPLKTKGERHSNLAHLIYNKQNRNGQKPLAINFA